MYKLKPSKRWYKEASEEEDKFLDTNAGIIDLPFDDRMKMVTHYIQSNIQPNNKVHVGFLEDGYFQTLYIDLHKQEAKRRNLIEYLKGNL